MWVRMLEGISGGRPGGGQWPPKGALLEVDDWEGESLIRGQLAVPGAPPPSERQAEVLEEKAPSVLEAVVAPPPAAPEADAPGPNAIKSDWVAFAVSQGSSKEEAESLTKVQLQSAFGGRLLSSR